MPTKPTKRRAGKRDTVAWQGTFKVDRDVFGNPTLFRWNGDEWAIFTDNPKAVESLARWLSGAAKWMRRTRVVKARRSK